MLDTKHLRLKFALTQLGSNNQVQPYWLLTYGKVDHTKGVNFYYLTVLALSNCPMRSALITKR
ncbi:hypothetical protein BG030_00135 [Pseudomonas putida]|nr:hypothetical protein BG030_00135 [Pseudomonas putida]